MKQNPVVTAIVTTYNRPTKIVDRALASVVKQTYPNLEIILVNDSPENTALAKELEQLCAAYPRPVQYVPMPKNSGANAARNLGAARAKGDFLAFLDDDDEWLETKVEQQVQAFTDETVGIVYCNTWIHSEKKHRVKPHYHNAMPEGDVYARLFCRNIVGSTSFPMIRREVFDQAGGFDTDMPALQDIELWLRITKNHTVKYLSEPLGTYYFYAGERISAHPERRTMGYEKIFEQHQAYLEAHPKVMADFDILGVTIYLNARAFQRAWFHLSRAVRLKPEALRRNLYTLIKYIIRFFVPAKIV